MRVLKLAFLLASAGALALADPFVIESVNQTTAVIPDASGPDCLPRTYSSYELQGAKVAIMVGDGTNADAFVAAYKYFSDRSASIDVVCSPSSENVLNTLSKQAVLMRMYYPIGKVSCSTIDSLWTISDKDVVVVPDGYAATLPFRRNTRATDLVSSFANPSSGVTSSSALLLVGGASEVLIDAGVIGSLNCTAQVPIATTPSMLTAITAACSKTAAKAKPSHHLIFGSHSVIVGAHHNDLPAMLAHWEANYKSTVAPDVKCNNTNTTVSFNYTSAAVTASVASLSSTDWQTVAAATDATAETVNSNTSTSVIASCTNAQGVNFCENAPTSIVVAHGSHARAVRSLASVFGAMNTINRVFCPDADEEHSFGEGYVYLSSQPAFVPTHRIACTAYYNRTDILTSTLVVIAGGDVATHRTLRNDANLVKALQYTGTFSAFGSGLALLNAIISSPKGGKETEESHVATDVTNAPYYADTNRDMESLGFVPTNATESVMLFRDHMERRTKVLGGYKSSTEFEANFVQFLKSSTQSLVWNNAPNDMADILVMAYVFGFSGLIIIGLLVVLCIRARVTTPSRNVGRDRVGSTVTEPLSMKFA